MMTADPAALLSVISDYAVRLSAAEREIARLRLALSQVTAPEDSTDG